MAPTGNGLIQVPLSFMQAEMWRLENSAEPGSFNVTHCRRVNRPLDRQALVDALAWMVERHEPLRTSFPAVDGVPCQQIAPSLPVQLPETDLRGVAAPARADERIRVVRDLDAVPFDVGAGPVFHAHLLLLSDEEWELVLTLDHLVADETALHMVLSEWEVAYLSLADGRPPDLPPLSIQYADYTLWEHGWCDDQRLSEELEYWLARLKGAPVEISLPYDHQPAASGKVYDVGVAPTVYELTFPAAVHEALTAIVHQCRATPFMVCLAAVAALVDAVSGQDDLVISTVVTGRDRPELERIVGDFSRMALLRADLSDDPPFTELVGRMREEVLGLLEHQHVSVLRVLGALRHDWANVATFAYPVDVQFFHAARRYWVPGTSVVESPPGQAGHVGEEIPAGAKPLSFVFYGDGESLWLKLRYQTECFEPATIEALVARLMAILAAAAADPTGRVSELAGVAEISGANSRPPEVTGAETSG